MLKALYNIILIIIYIPFAITIFLRRFFKKEHPLKFKEKFISNNIIRPPGYFFWFHVASLGEFNSILPFIDYYLEKNKNYKILITTVTLSSYLQFEKKFKDNQRVFHQFLPYDLNWLVKNFLNNWKPDIVSFVDSEIWPNFIFEIHKRRLPFILLNGRITKKTFRRWMFLKKFAYNIFNSFSVCISASKESAENLRMLKAKNIKYFGNIKFCSTKKDNKDSINNEFISIKNKNVWVALSTHGDEEHFCLDVHKLIEKVEKNIVTIIIPRHINRITKIYSWLSKLDIKTQIKNENDKIHEDSKIILVNYYGLTSKYLNNFKQIFIGKSLLPSLANVGGQNPIDAIKMGCKVYHGPYVYNFQEIYDYLDQNNFAEKLEKEKSVASKMLAEKLIGAFKNSNQESTNKVAELDIYSKKIFDNVVNEYSRFIK